MENPMRYAMKKRQGTKPYSLIGFLPHLCIDIEIIDTTVVKDIRDFVMTIEPTGYKLKILGIIDSRSSEKPHA